MGLKQRLWVNMEWSLVLLLSSVVAADLHHDLQPFKAQMDRLLAVNDDLEARVTALESQMTALQSMVTAQQSEVVAVQKEVASVDTHLIEVEDALTNLTVRYNATVGLVEIMESSITTTITRVNQTEVRVSLVEEGVSSVNGTAKNNTAGLIELGTSLTGTNKQLAATTGLANETAIGLDMVNSTLVQVKQLVRMHGKVIATANEAIKNINNKELPDVRESVEENHEMVKKNKKELEQDASLISDNKVAIVDNSKDIDHAERSINNLGKALDVVTRKVRANRKTASGNKDSIKEINREMTYVKTQVVEFCGYQSSWGKEDKSVTYEYLTVSENTVDESKGEERHPPTPRPTRPPHHKLPGLNTKSGMFVAPMSGTYRVSFQVGHLETPDTNGEHRTSIFVRKNGLKDESLHMETKSHAEETNVIAHEALVKMSKEDTLDVFVDETKDDLYGILFCVALV